MIQGRIQHLDEMRKESKRRFKDYFIIFGLSNEKRVEVPLTEMARIKEEWNFGDGEREAHF